MVSWRGSWVNITSGQARNPQWFKGKQELAGHTSHVTAAVDSKDIRSGVWLYDYSARTPSEQGKRIREMIRRICVFCGSSDGARPEYLDAATELGKQLAARNIGLVLVEREVAHSKLRDLRVVGSMHERKALMAELANAFIALPG